MDEKTLVEQIVRDILKTMDTSKVESQSAAENPILSQTDKARGLTAKDYPLSNKRPELIKGPTGKKLQDISMEKVISGQIEPQDVSISKDTLKMQAEIASSVGRTAFAGNLDRAAELTAIPDDRILEIYNALRPYRSTKQEILSIADEIETNYGAKINAEFIREAAEAYEKRNRLKQ